MVASIDVLVDGVHFRTDWATGEQIGQRAALAAMADVAAMGAAPTALLVGLTAPPSTAVELVAAIGRGLNQAAGAAGAGVVGGDLTRSEVLTIAVTALGDLRGPATWLPSPAGSDGPRPDSPCCPGAFGHRPLRSAPTGCPSRHCRPGSSPRNPAPRR